MPHVCKNLAVHVLELVQLRHLPTVVRDCNVTHFFERFRIEEMELRRAVAQNERFGVVGQAPSFPWVGQRAEQPKAEPIVDERYVRFPGELNESASPVGETLSEEFRGNRV